MKQTITRSIIPLLGALVGSNRRRNPMPMLRPMTRTRVATRTGNTLTQTQRRNRRRRKNFNGVDINRAEGGFKKITLPYRTQGIGINTYARLVVTKIGNDWQYGLQPETENYATYQEYNIMLMLNNSVEFKNRLRTTSQYKVLGVRICIMNNRIPSAKDRLSKLLAYVNTTKVGVFDPKIQSNVMSLNMNTVGTKNYNFNLNNANIGKDFTGWFDGEDLYTGNVYLHVAGLDENYLNEQEQTTVILGTVKITFSVLTRIQDYLRNQEPTKKMSNEEKIKELENEIQRLKVSNSKAEIEQDDDEGSEYEGDEEFINSLSKHDD
jgi:hypothetical protein